MDQQQIFQGKQVEQVVEKVDSNSYAEQNSPIRIRLSRQNSQNNENNQNNQSNENKSRGNCQLIQERFSENISEEMKLKSLPIQDAYSDKNNFTLDTKIVQNDSGQNNMNDDLEKQKQQSQQKQNKGQQMSIQIQNPLSEKQEDRQNENQVQNLIQHQIQDKTEDKIEDKSENKIEDKIEEEHQKPQVIELQQIYQHQRNQIQQQSSHNADESHSMEIEWSSSNTEPLHFSSNNEPIQSESQNSSSSIQHHEQNISSNNKSEIINLQSSLRQINQQQTDMKKKTLNSQQPLSVKQQTLVIQKKQIQQTLPTIQHEQQIVAIDEQQDAEQNKQLNQIFKQNSKIDSTTQNGEYSNSIQQIQEILKLCNYKNYMTPQNAKHFEFILRDFSPYLRRQSKQQKKQGFKLTQDFFNISFSKQALQDILFMSLIFKNSIFHARIAFLIYIIGYGSKQTIKQFNLEFDQKLLQLKRMLCNEQKIKYSFDQCIWSEIKQTGYKYRSFSSREPQKEKVSDATQNNKKLKNNSTLKKIKSLLKRFYFTSPHHKFSRKMSHLTQDSYKISYIVQFSFFCFKNKKQIIQFQQNETYQFKDHRGKHFNNILFYSNLKKVTWDKITLQQIQKDRKNNYKWLEQSHDYIQWLFPNHFQSAFNSQSYQMGYIEAEIFKLDYQLRSRLLTSFQIYLDFIGCIIDEDKNGMFIQQPKNGKPYQRYQRLKQALIFNTHNHLRVMRILACLSITGFRKYAQQFIELLKYLGSQGRYFKNQSSYMSSLKGKWLLYSSENNNKQKTLQMCFLPYDNFPICELIKLQIKQKINSQIEKPKGQDAPKQQNQKQQMNQKIVQQQENVELNAQIPLVSKQILAIKELNGQTNENSDKTNQKNINGNSQSIIFLEAPKQQKQLLKKSKYLQFGMI